MPSPLAHPAAPQGPCILGSHGLIDLWGGGSSQGAAASVGVVMRPHGLPEVVPAEPVAQASGLSAEVMGAWAASLDYPWRNCEET